MARVQLLALALVLCTLLCAVSSKSNRHILFSKKAIDTLSTPTTSLLETETSSTHYEWLVHVSHTLTRDEKAALNELVAPYKLGAYMPQNTYLFYAPASEARKLQNAEKVLWIGVLDAEHKIPELFDTVASNANGLLVALAKSDLRTPEETAAIAHKWEKNFKSGKISVKVVRSDRVLVDISKSGVSAREVAEWIAQQTESHWVEPVAKNRFHNNYVRPAVLTNDEDTSNPFIGFADVSINGSSQTVGIIDSGLDYGSCYFIGGAAPTSELNPDERKVVKYVVDGNGNLADDTGHGTFVAGIIAGESINADSSADYNGIAPAAKISFVDVDNNGAGYVNTEDFDIVMIGLWVDVAGTIVTSFGSDASWYSLLSLDVDDFTFGYQESLVVVAAGTNSLSELGYSKNALVVGASQSFVESLEEPLASTSGPIDTTLKSLFGTQALASFSPIGPTADGRMKPDLVAPGQRIRSASTSGSCTTEVREGTSYAAAAAAGASAVVRDWFTKGFFTVGVDPLYDFSQTAALTKAMLINSAQSLKVGQVNGNCLALENFWPSSYQGFGRIQLDRVIPVSGGDFSIQVFDDREPEAVQPQQTRRFCFRADNPVPWIKLTLVWSDPAGTPTSGQILVNDLDLVMYDTNGNEWRTQTFGGDFDRQNNVEQIYATNLPAGMYAFAVYGHRIVTETGQSWAFVGTGDVDWTVGCNQGFDNSTHTVCPNSCSGHGNCTFSSSYGSYCACEEGHVGVDCSQTPCLNDCSENGYCDHITATCVCNLDYDPASGCADKILPPNETQAPPPPVVINETSPEQIGYYIGVGALGLVVGALIFGVIGFFCAVKVLEKRRDALMKDKEEMH